MSGLQMHDQQTPWCFLQVIPIVHKTNQKQSETELLRVTYIVKPAQ